MNPGKSLFVFPFPRAVFVHISFRLAPVRFQYPVVALGPDVYVYRVLLLFCAAILRCCCWCSCCCLLLLFVVVRPPPEMFFIQTAYLLLSTFFGSNENTQNTPWKPPCSIIPQCYIEVHGPLDNEDRKEKKYNIISHDIRSSPPGSDRLDFPGVWQVEKSKHRCPYVYDEPV